MGDDDPKREEGGRFQETIPLDAVIDVFDQVEGPIITSSDVADVLDCARKTAKRKLESLDHEGRVQSRSTAGRTVYWKSDSEKQRFTEDETRPVPNERLRKRLDHLCNVTESTIAAEYHGGGVFMLRSRDGNFWGSVYDALDRTTSGCRNTSGTRCTLKKSQMSANATGGTDERA